MDKIEKIEMKSLEVAPDYLQNHAHKGALSLELLGPDDIQRSFVKLCQKEISTRPGIKPGYFYNSVTLENYGPEIDIIIIDQSKTWIKFSKELELVGTSMDGLYWNDGSQLGVDQVSGLPESLTCLSYHYFIILKNKMEAIPLIFTTRNTANQAGKALNSMLKRFVFQNNEPIFGRSYKATSVVTVGKNNEYHLLKVNLNPGFLSSSEVDFAAKVYDMVNRLDKKELIKEPTGLEVEVE